MPWQKLSNRQNPYISNPKNWPDYYCLAYETKDKTGKLCRAELIEYFDLRQGGRVNALVLFLNEDYPDNTEETFKKDLSITEWVESYGYDKEKNAIILNWSDYGVTERLLEYLVKNAKVLPEDFLREVKSNWSEQYELRYIKIKRERAEEINSKRQSTDETKTSFEYARSLLNSNREEALKCLRAIAEQNSDAARYCARYARDIREKLHFVELADTLGDGYAKYDLPSLREEVAMLDLDVCWSNKPAIITREFLDEFKALLIKTESLLRERLTDYQSFERKNCLKVQDFFDLYYLLLARFLSTYNEEGLDQAFFEAYEQTAIEQKDECLSELISIRAIEKAMTSYCGSFFDSESSQRELAFTPAP